jgi:hypothetical protein
MLRIRKSIKVLPGLRLNVSKSGTSWTVGRPGASVNLGGKRGARATIGMPGTGVSTSVPLSGRDRNLTAEQAQSPKGADMVSALASAVLAFFGWVIAGAVAYALAAVSMLGKDLAGSFAWLPTAFALVMAVRAYRRRRRGVV